MPERLAAVVGAFLRTTDTASRWLGFSYSAGESCPVLGPCTEALSSGGSVPDVKVKGRALLDTVENIRNRRGEPVLQELIASLSPPHQQVFRDGIVFSHWYPLDAMTALMTADVAKHDGGNGSVVVQRSEEVIDKQLRGVYRIFIRFGSPEFVIKRIAAIHETYFENVGVEHQFLEDKRAVVRYAGFEPSHAIIEHAIVGFYRKALQIAGAARVDARFVVPIASGRPSADVEIRWS